MDLKQSLYLARCPLAAGTPRGGYCWWCQKKLVGRQRKWCSEDHCFDYLENHHWPYARRAAVERDGYKCVKCGSTEQLEVNHIKPVLGKHAQNGCWHHQTGLITLCHACHVLETKAQRERGEFAPRPKRRKKKRARR